MKRTSKSFSITIVLACLLLACLLLNILGATNSWFTVGGQQIQIAVNVGGLNIKVNQTDDANATNPRELDATNSSYINLEGVIEPNVIVPVYLQLSFNENSPLYLRFKFQVIALGVEDKEITTQNTIVSNASKNGFLKDSDGWYYYRDSSNALAKFSTGNIMLISGFRINEAEFLTLNGETIKIVLSVECADTQEFE